MIATIKLGLLILSVWMVILFGFGLLQGCVRDDRDRVYIPTPREIAIQEWLRMDHRIEHELRKRGL